MITNSSNPVDNILLQILQQRTQTQDTASPQQAPVKKALPVIQDKVELSDQSKSDTPDKERGETTQTDNGFRRVENFTSPDGREFTRIEEVIITPDRTKRTVIQQNESGSTTQLENVLDRQDDGAFRLIQRFTNETGETETNVQLDFNPEDADILLGRPSEGSFNNLAETPPPFQSLRGTQIDLTA